ncbi:signal peptidase I [Sutcliffiella rhizosphaerae]|uniref:Signal peptidase I n=1 Tax=Sutcliffiella rhizosphaerae TaxID=2880967 RepID=A0ABN8A9U3_9BACI|nr:signal peptidase I [Sutcliffiella rhizosphaerae]CAG9620762.1 Signal peptidase I W [Sutcliffiella rhizosphaerae]
MVKGIMKVLSTLILIVLAIAAGLVIFFVSQSKGDIEKVPSVFGYKPLTILSNSMQPYFNAGDVILIKPDQPPKVNDVITFKHPEGILVTHRIIDTAVENGKNVFITKGDNNNTADELMVTSESILGVQTNIIPGAGHVAKFVAGPIGFILLIGVPIFIFLLIEIFQRTGIIGKRKESHSN